MDLKTRKGKLVALKKYLNLETNVIKTTNIGSVLYEKVLAKKHLDRRIDKCTKCKNLNIPSYTKAIAGWGNLNANIFFIGESPCLHSMTTRFPFAWKSGNILDIVLRLSSVTRYDVFVSNSIHCHPESKRAPTDREQHRCSHYLYTEIELVEPTLIVTLGNSAKAALEHINKHTSLMERFQCKHIHKTHPAKFLYSNTGLRDYIVKFSLDLDKYT